MTAKDSPRTRSGQAWLNDLHEPKGPCYDSPNCYHGAVILAIEAEAAAPSGQAGAVGPVRITSGNCFAGDHDECLGMVEQDVAELGITDCMCHCHAPATAPPPLDVSALADAFTWFHTHISGMCSESHMADAAAYAAPSSDSPTAALDVEGTHCPTCGPAR